MTVLLVLMVMFWAFTLISLKVEERVSMPGVAMPTVDFFMIALVLTVCYFSAGLWTNVWI